MIGILGDTHDNLDAIGKAVEFFNGKGVKLVIHTGDIVSPFSVESFKNLKCDFKAVYGNNEGDRFNLARKLKEIDAEITDFLELDYDEKRIAIYHGQNPSILDAIVKCGKYDVVITGHTHTPEVTLDDNTLIVNPGETCGYMTGVMTVAVLNTSDMKADIHTLK
ncbi:MAG: metallophosphoesterase [Candidatus Altiarchaeota archaeon]